MTPRKSAPVRLPPYPATRNGSADRFWTASTCSWKCRRWNTRSWWTKRQPKTPATPGKGWNRPVTFSGSGSRTTASYVTQRWDRRKSGNRAPLDESAKSLLQAATQRLNLSARAFHRILKVSRTIADLDAARDIGVSHLAEALQYRSRGFVG